MARYQRSLFLFDRDLRLDDNMALSRALDESDEVIPVFPFNQSLTDRDSESFNAKQFQFLLGSLEDLDARLCSLGSKLHCIRGESSEIVRRLVADHGIEAVFANRHYTPSSNQNDDTIRDLCRDLGVAFLQSDDAMLTPPELVTTKASTPYKVFTPYFRAASLERPPRPSILESRSFYTGSLSDTLSLRSARTLLPQANEQLEFSGGRDHALTILDDIESLADYSATRDVPSDRTSTSGLSPHLNLGCISIREVYWRVADSLGRNHPLIRQLYWRDFFTQLAWQFPHVFSSAFKAQYNNVKWSHDEERFAAWCEGRTGFPIVDAGMRQLNLTGWMHNRVRMITASFLTKDLHIDWRWGEKYFAQHLVDYDPAINNGSWQWAASTGADAQPWFRVFNPWLQQRKFDPSAEYIRRWIPELRPFEPKRIHAVDKNPMPSVYPAPIVNHREEREEALRRFQEVG